MIPVVFIGIAIACGGGGPSVGAPDGAVTTDTAVVVDSIGLLMGDSNYVFGSVVDFAPLQDGGTVVLDRLDGRISLFDAEGRFASGFGALGEGPGRFQYPVRVLELPSGLFLVGEMLAGTINVFDPTGAFIDRWSMEGVGVFPLAMAAFDDSSFLSYNFQLVLGMDDYGIRFSLWRYHALTGEVLTRYMTWDGEASPSTDFRPAYLCFTTDREGSMFLSRVEDPCWRVEVFGTGPVAVDTVILFPERSRLPLESDSLPVPGVAMISYMYQDESGGSGQMSTNPPDEHPVISALAWGPDGNLWARRGGYPAADWDVVSVEGAHVGSIHFAGTDSMPLLDVRTGPGGIRAIDPLNEDYHRVYVYQAP
jgi:hypothetical protein